MSAIKQIQIGGGTTYDVNDLRVATSVVTTATHVLATNSAVSAINPIAMASLASVLGVFTFVGKGAYNDIPTKSGIYNISGGSTSVYPAQYGILAVFNSENRDARLLLFLSLSGWESTTSPKVYYSSARESGESLIMKPWVEV